MPDIETTRFVVEIVIAVLLTPFAVVMWFLLRKLIADQKELEKALADHQLHVATSYIQKEDFNRTADALFKKLDSIEDFIRGNNHHDPNP